MHWWLRTILALVLTPAAMAEQLLLDSGRDPAFWTSVNGSEYPGATATVDVVTDGECGPCVRATCTFAGESRYAGLQWRGSVAEGEAIGFRVKPLHRRHGLIRVKDATGQWLAGAFKARQGVWTDVRIPLKAETFSNHWGGANDGDVHAAPHDAPSDFWKSDSLQIALDSANDSVDAFDEDDREIGLVLTKQGPRVYVGFPKAPRRVNAPVAVRRAEGKTVYETTLPWALLDLPRPQPDTVMAINLIANDNDGHGRGYWMGLTPGIGEAKNPQAYREFVVVPDRKGPQ